MGHDINKLTEKYWAGNTSPEEERWLQDHADDIPEKADREYFRYLRSQRDIRMPDVNKRRRHFNFRRLAAVIALLLLPLIWVVTQDNKDQIAQQYEVKDPEEAMRITKTVLGVMSQQMERAKAHTTEISKFNKVEQKIEAEL